MANRKVILGDAKTDPPLGPLGGLKLMRRDRASAIHATGDRVLSHGRRILCRMGLAGAGAWQVSDLAPAHPVAIHPPGNIERVVARLPAVPLTPGHVLVMQVVASPSGQSAVAVGDVAISTGILGTIRIVATYANSGGPVSVTRDISIPGSKLPYGAQPSSAGAAWGELYRRRTSPIKPADFGSIANIAQWVEGVTVAVVVSFYRGAPRVIDLIVYEVPEQYARDLADDEWITPMHSDGAGYPLTMLPGQRPVCRRLAADPGGGSEIVADAGRRLREVGPALWYATAWCESTSSYTATETPARSVTGTTLTELVEGSTTAWSAASAGASLSSGGNGRRVQDSEQTAIMRDADNVVPVTCWIYCRLTAAVITATVRFEAEAYSVAVLSIPAGTSFAWRSVTGHLRCGLGSESPTTVQVFAATSSAGGVFEWRYAVITFGALA